MPVGMGVIVRCMYLFIYNEAFEMYLLVSEKI